MNDETLEYECFGGEYRPKVYDQCKEPILVPIVATVGFRESNSK